VIGRQLNIRLSATARDRLEALAFLRRTTASTLARDMVLDYLDRFRDEAGFEEALAALAEHDAGEALQGDVRRLATRPRSG
jgi:predicted transcriptional regulator